MQTEEGNVIITSLVGQNGFRTDYTSACRIALDPALTVTRARLNEVEVMKTNLSKQSVLLRTN